MTSPCGYLSASAPGKVLLCGGYLVTEAPNLGLSVGVDARFHTRLQIDDDESSSGNDQQGDKVRDDIVIYSPQFGSVFAYRVAWSTSEARDPSPKPAVSVSQTQGPASPFLHHAVLACAAWKADAIMWTHNASVTDAQHLPKLVSRPLRLTLLADNDFYSQRAYLERLGLPVTPANLRQVPPHQPLEGKISKTGLGSSAALTMSLVACLATALCRDASLRGTADVSQNVLHRIAQIAHCVAQGKIGSGFDVFTACYGTCVYRRFPSSLIERVMNVVTAATAAAATGNGGETIRVEVGPFAAVVRDQGGWAAAERATASHGGSTETSEGPRDRMPRGLHVMLADIYAGGSSTPGMTAKITEWKKRTAAASSDGKAPLWQTIAGLNERFIATLAHLRSAAKEYPTEYDGVIATLADVPSRDWVASAACSPLQRGIFEHFFSLRDISASLRRKMRQMGEEAAVEVEPASVTPLLDGTIDGAPGVACVGCPGAGGYDAVYALVVSSSPPGPSIARVEDFWVRYAALQVCPLLVREGGAGLQFNHDAAADRAADSSKRTR